MAYVVMPCYRLIPAFQTDDGSIVFSERGRIRRSLFLPCGQCIGCRLERSRQWAVRCMHESQMHEFSSFVTLTYSDDNYHPSLNYRDFQLFMKRVRARFRARVRFFMCGEYGSTLARPHFHACLFGLFFSDRRFLKTLPSGSRLYTSAILEDLWPYGFSSIGDVTFQSAAYVARYVTKKVTGSDSLDHYRVVDGDTGEVIDRVPEFAHMSLKPGIGFPWYERYCKEVFPRDYVVMNGVRMKPPKYYFQLLKDDPTLMSDEVEFSRFEKSIRMADDNTDERLLVRERVAEARVGLLKRSL